MERRAPRCERCNYFYEQKEFDAHRHRVCAGRRLCHLFYRLVQAENHSNLAHEPRHEARRPARPKKQFRDNSHHFRLQSRIQIQ